MRTSYKSGFVHVLLLILILVFVVLACFVFVLSQLRYRSVSTTKSENNGRDSHPSPTETISSWKNYKNEKFGFEISYPNSWELEERETDVKENIYPNSAIPIVFIRKDQNTFVDFEFNKEAQGPQSLDEYVIKLGPQSWKNTRNSIQGYDTHSFEIQAIGPNREDNPNEVTSFLFMSNGKILTLTWSVPFKEMTLPEMSPEIKGILDTFKLINQ